MSRSIAAQIRRNAGRAPRLTLAIGFTAILVLSAGMVAGAIPNSGTGVINGCYEKNTGLLRVIDTQAGKTCTRWEIPISWSQTGPRGEAGAEGEDGQDGADGRDGADGADGTDGLDGLQGVDGADGQDGNSVLNGTSNPSADTGVPGDFYIDTTTSTLYGPKSEAGWGQGASLVGQQGPQGEQGEQGAPGVGGTLSSLNDLSGIPCTIGSRTGIVAMSNTGDTITLTCAPRSITLTVSVTPGLTPDPASGGIMRPFTLPIMMVDANGNPTAQLCGASVPVCQVQEQVQVPEGATVGLRSGSSAFTATWTGCDSAVTDQNGAATCFVTMDEARSVAVVFGVSPGPTP